MKRTKFSGILRYKRIQQDIVMVNERKGTYQIVAFAVPVHDRVKLKEKEKRDEYLDFARELKKTLEHESDSDTICGWCTWNPLQRIGKEKLGNTRTSRDHPNYSIIKIGQNSEKSPGDSRRLAVTQTPVRNYNLTLVLKTRKREKKVFLV